MISSSGRHVAAVVAGVLAATLSSLVPAAANAPATSSSPGKAPVVYLLAGTRASVADVYEWRVGTRRVHRLTYEGDNGPGVSWLMGSPGGVVIADGITGLATLHGRRIHHVTIHGPARVQTPEVSNDGQLAFTNVKNPSAKHATFAIVVRRTITAGHLRTVATQRDPAWIDSPTWSPDGQRLAFEHTAATQHRLRVITPEGRTVARLPLRSDAWPLTWNPKSDLISAGSEVVNVDTGAARRVRAGWRAYCWNGSGSKLLAARGRRLALINPHHPRMLQHVGALRGLKVYGCAYPANH